MTRSTNIKLSLIGFLCLLNFVGFSQDTTLVEPPPIRIDSIVENPEIQRTDVGVSTEVVPSVVEELNDTIQVNEPPMGPRINAQNPPPQTSSRNEPYRPPGYKNPKLAGWLSTGLPGAGQVYNGQWWKVPVIYGGVGFLVYLHEFNRKERDIFQKEYRGRRSGDTTFVRNPDLTLFSESQILSARNYYRRNLELVYVFSGLLYILNIVDAIVFAHLATFDVSDNLTMRIEPFATPDLSPFASNHRVPMQGGLRLTFTLK